MIVIGSHPCTAFSQLQNSSWGQQHTEWEEQHATKSLHVVTDAYHEQIRAGRYFLHEHPVGDVTWTCLRVAALQKTKGVFTVTSPVCCFETKVKTKDGSGMRNKYVYKPTKWMTNSSVLAQALDRRCSNSSGPPYHRHILMKGGMAEMTSAYAPELVNTVLRALRQQMLEDGCISELELKFSGPSRSEPVFNVNEDTAQQWADEFDNLTGARLPGELVHKGKMEEID